jgi:uncharacterized membrane protein HdeD (DUF308 family)
MAATTTKTPGWRRWLQIGLGAIAIILAIYAIVFPGITLVSLVSILAIVFLIVGIEKVISGIFIPGPSRWASVGLGILVIIIASIALAYPVGTTAFVIFLLGFALLIYGFSVIAHGFGDRTRRGWSRGFAIGIGVLAVIVAIMIMISPFFGAVLAGLLIGIILLLIGIEIIAAGIAGRPTHLTPPGMKR